MKRRLIFDLALCCLCAAVAAEVGAQGYTGPGFKRPPPVRFTQLGGPCGLRQYVSTAWGVVGIEVLNEQDQPVDVLAAFSFSPDPDLQFARRIGVPAQAVRRTWVPLQLPRVPTSRISIPCYGLLIDDRSGSEVVLRPDYEGVQHSTLLRVNHDKPITGAFLEEQAEADSDDVDYAYEAVIALRTSRGYQRGLVLIRARDLPPLPEVFDGLNQIVLWNDRFASDVAILDPLRSWLNDGGELWVMLDRVDPAGVEQLLGELFTCQVVDRVALDQVLIEDAELPAFSEAPKAEQYEQPLALVRTLVSEMRVTHTVNGWPAAFWRPVGRGRVVFTTLDARAWIGRPPLQRPRWDVQRMTNYWPTPQLDALPLLRPYAPPLSKPELFYDYLAEGVGYRIASRGSVSGLLGLFCGSLLLAGVVLARRHKLEHLAWIAPGLALVAAVPLAGLGLRSQRAVPATVGQAQFIEVSDGADQLTASGLLAFYDPTGKDSVIGAARGGVFEAPAAANTTQRMVWTDLGHWHWENLRPTTGLWTAAFRWSGDLPQRLALRGTFSDQGFVAHWTDSSLALTDAMIAIPGQPYLAVQADGSRLVAGPDDVLPPGRYVAGSWLSDEQRRRQAVIDRMLEATGGGKVRQVLRPTLLGWGAPLEMGFQFPSTAERFGAAWWSIPLHIDRPAPGTQVLIPSSFVAFRAVNQPDSTAASSLYDYRTGEWLASQKPSELWLRFQVPEAVLPLQLDRAQFTLQITAPDCTVEIRQFGSDPQQPLRRLSNPIGEIELTLAGQTLPPLDADGRFLVGVSVQPTASGGGRAQLQSWRIERVQMEIAGLVGEDRQAEDGQGESNGGEAKP